MTTPQSTRETAAINAVARETLRRIAQERISPTPENYARLYRAAQVTHPDHPLSAPPADAGAEARALSATLARLVAQVEAHHAGITVTRKREGLKRALVPRAEPIEALRARIERLMDSWNGPNAEVGAHVSQFLGTDVMGTQVEPEVEPLSESQAFAVTTQALGALKTTAVLRPDTAAARPGVAFRAASASPLPDRVISVRLAGLIALILKNIEELTPESALLGNQIEQVGRVLTAPLTEQKLDEAERCLRALIVRQGAIKHSLDETKRAVRDLASTLLDRLSTLMSSTDYYSSKVVGMAERIAETQDLGQLSSLTQMLVSDAHLMAANVASEHAMLAEARSRAQALQERTAALEHELKEASTLVRTDPLTRALNRRGFADAFAVQAKNGGTPVVALIDVDNFKNINEEHGHAVGDEVLCRLVEVLHRGALPDDTVARYGGEEFALIFPHVDVEEAERRVFDMQRLLRESAVGTGQPAITFSAGVTRVEQDETLASGMTRADRALREAKHAGKNCIRIAARAMSDVPA